MFYGRKNDEPPLPFFPEFCVKSARRIAEALRRDAPENAFFAAFSPQKRPILRKKTVFMYNIAKL
jgi:hypothetical protein